MPILLPLIAVLFDKTLALILYVAQANGEGDRPRVVWQFFLLIASAGVLGGIANALMSHNGFIVPRQLKTSEGAIIFQPGVLGNVFLGVIAALVFWLLNTDFDGVQTIMSNGTMKAIGAALLAAAAGARILTSEVDKLLLRAAAVDATKVQPNAERAREAAAEIQNASPARALELAKTIGYRCGKSSYKVEILDLDGTCKMTRYWKGVKVVGGLKLSKLPSEVQLTTPGGSIKSFPRLVEKVNFPKHADLTVEPSKGPASRCMVRLDIEGGLTQENPELDYGYEYLLSRGFLMTREEVEDAYKDDSDVVEGEALAIGDGEDADTLEVELIFPTGFAVEPEWGVMLRKFGVKHEGEYERIRSNRERLTWGYRFRVERPLSTCEYYVHWWPPSKISRIIDS